MPNPSPSKPARGKSKKGSKKGSALPRATVKKGKLYGKTGEDLTSTEIDILQMCSQNLQPHDPDYWYKMIGSLHQYSIVPVIDMNQ